MSQSFGEARPAPPVLLPSLTQQILLQKLTAVQFVLLILGGIICLFGAVLFGMADDIARRNVEEDFQEQGFNRREPGPEQNQAKRQREEQAARIMRVIGALFTSVGVAYLIFAAFVKKYPAPITIMSMALFITGNALTMLSPDHPFAFIAATWWLSIPALAVLSMALRVALTYARERRRTETIAHQQEVAEAADDERAAGFPHDRDFGVQVRPCWRCDKDVAADAHFCPFCHAPFGSRRVAAATDDRGYEHFHRETRPVKIVLWFFVILLSVTICQAWYIHFGPGLGGNQQEQEMALLKQLLIVDAIATLIVLIAVIWARSPAPFTPSSTSRISTWVLGLPFLALLLGINIGYGKLLQEYVGQQQHVEVIPINFDNHFYLVLLCICIQPAVVEEMFFRHLCLGHLRGVMSEHGAIWVTAVMFGLAHLHNAIGMPVLIVIGAGFGYMRVKSGGLALPMLMHGLHNAIVTMLDGKI